MSWVFFSVLVGTQRAIANSILVRFRTLLTFNRIRGDILHSLEECQKVLTWKTNHSYRKDRQKGNV